MLGDDVALRVGGAARDGLDEFHRPEAVTEVREEEARRPQRPLEELGHEGASLREARQRHVGLRVQQREVHLLQRVVVHVGRAVGGDQVGGGRQVFAARRGARRVGDVVREKAPAVRRHHLQRGVWCPVGRERHGEPGPCGWCGSKWCGMGWCNGWCGGWCNGWCGW